MSKVYEYVTERILAELANGVVPWRRPWGLNGLNRARNWESKRSYTGINAFLLPPGEYATANQIRKAGGTIKKGSKSHMVCFWKKWEGKTEEGEEGEEQTEARLVLRYYLVFEINTQVEGLKTKLATVEDEIEHTPLEAAEAIAGGFAAPRGPALSYDDMKAYYRPMTDSVHMPDKRHFPQLAEFYSTLFHELAHSTGHESRLNRLARSARFGDTSYSREELVAEMTSGYLCSVAGIPIEDTVENQAAYIASWASRLKDSDDKKLVVWAAGQAAKAADYILNS